eukprot:Protomagalhaensia_wolfi_Nauph_80__4686@NODE_485_length_2444_cov_142_120166_g365_i0_p2_GENE_NODE_485_length_2444_cov_142_120166_g365_i0NODE_485_length_2444_cov_142_120166_g365_i0_p2_ORF_typecomplete_len216_score36_601433/PF00244_20/8_7e35TPR_18/PF13512_6/1_2e02TPR_18/PF13512_6/0_36TPR_16/PF13432_6/5_1e02TPR_16/PF13432_6/75TPR_16/PF13432_6/4_7TPR_12/PF13424_6/4e03TPR_12/PF13424_6/3_6e03TPR_12/PF13424_6/49TPR_12/PF13424_6/0_35PilJ/PF13675_6/3_4e02PilJ/PF13675_6/2_1PilJ/PF13675_6/2_3e02ST7/PF04184_1
MSTALVYEATVAEKCGRYHEMVAAVTKMARSSPELDKQERALFTEAFRQAIGKLRSSSRLMEQIYKRKERRQPQAARTTLEYKRQLDMEIQRLCHQCLDALQGLQGGGSHQKLFVAKETADIHRYLAEIDESKVPDAERFYSDALKAADILPSGDPLRLATHLNFAIFQYDVLRNAQAALATAQRALQETPQRPDSREESLIRGLIERNIQMWRE